MHKINIYINSPTYDRLDVVYGSEMPISITVRDYSFADDSVARAFVRKDGDSKIYSLPASISGNVITLAVPAGAIPAGHCDIQVEITESGKKIISFKIPTLCEGNILDGDVGEVEYAMTAAARAEAAAKSVSEAAQDISEIKAAWKNGEFTGFSHEDADLLKDILYMGEYSTIDRALEAKDKVDALIMSLKGIKVSGINAEYNGGEVTEGTLVKDISGIVVTAIYTDGSVENVETFTAIPEAISTGINSIRITYRGKSANLTIVGTPKPVKSITAIYNGGDVIEGTPADDLRPNITVTAIYEDDTTAVVDGYTITGTVVVGTNDFVVEYAGATAVITVTGTEKPRTDIKGEPVFDGYYINKNVSSKYYQLATVNGRCNYIWHAEANKTYLYKWTYIYSNINPAIATTNLSNVASNPEAGVWAGNTETDMKDATTSRITTNGFILPVFVNDSGSVKEESGGYSRTIRIQFAQDCWVSINTAAGNYALYIYEE